MASIEQDILSELQLPLSELLRPRTLADYIGQTNLINSPNGEISNFLRLGYLPSMILCGPPGVGKTSIARLLADHAHYVFVELSATDSTVADLRELSGQIRDENASRLRRGSSSPRLRVVVFIDEIHRFTSVQQDFLLPFIESGDFVFLGATTVEPQKRIRGAIMSRCQLFRLEALDEKDVFRVICRAVLYQNIKRKRCMQLKFLQYSEESMEDIARYANGDMRAAINVIELMSSNFENDKYKVDGLSSTEMVGVTTQDVSQLIESLNKARFGLAHSSSLPYMSSMFTALRSSEPTKVQTRVSTPKQKAQHALNSSPIRQVLVKDFEQFPESQVWDEHMIYSDDSDVEPGNIYSDDEDTGSGDYPEPHLVRAIECILLMLRNGESPHFIIKTLIVHACKWPPSQEATLVKLVSAFKSLQKSDSNSMQVLIACIETLIGRLPRYEERLDTAVCSIKTFTNNDESVLPKRQRAQDVVLNVTYDDAWVDQLLSTTETSSATTMAPLEVVSLQDLPDTYTTGGDIGMEWVL